MKPVPNVNQRMAVRQVREAAESMIFALNCANQRRDRALLAGLTGPQIYEAAVTILLRLAFLLAAERLKRLPAANPFYLRHYSVSALAVRLRKESDQNGAESLERSHNAWDCLLRTFRAIFSGLRDTRLRLPALGGNLFHPDRCPFLRERLIDDCTVLRLITALEVCGRANAEREVIESIGRIHEQLLDHTARRTNGRLILVAHAGRRQTGTHYTPPCLTKPLVESALEPLVYIGPTEGLPRKSWKMRPSKEILNLKICDPACGSGAFLVEACSYLADRLTAVAATKYRRLSRARRLVAQRCLYGVDQDPLAVELTKLSLWLFTASNDRSFLDRSIRCGDSLLGCLSSDPGASATGVLRPAANAPTSPFPASAFHWPIEFPEVFRERGGFDAVLGNPPWGQKVVAGSDAHRTHIRQNYVSCTGIFDLFRPFIERGVRLLADNSVFAMVLPDILLLKDYPDTRKFLLDHLAFRRIDWWGQAFAGAMIDTITLIGIRTRPSPGHKVQVCLHERGAITHRRVRQESFWKNPKYTFNLHLTGAAREALDFLEDLPTLGDFFEIHEGVHSGNLRGELFVERPLDDTCREMYFGRDEIRPYALQWRGKYIRLSAVPAKKSRARYANAGRSHWFEQPKVLVRRTGDHVLAAPDISGRYASNNFFVVIPRKPCGLDPYGLCAILNSRFMTWFFRTIEPRQGRVFAELKIKHLKRFPLPLIVARSSGCDRLNALGLRRANDALAAKRADIAENHQDQDTAIENYVRQLYGLAQLASD